MRYSKQFFPGVNKKIGYGLIILLMTASCSHSRIKFSEFVLDTNGPDGCWTKTAGDLNGDSIPDLVIGGYNGGGIWVYFSPDHGKKLITDWRGAKTDAEIADMNNDGKNDIVALFDSAIWWFANPGWEPHFVDSLVCHDLEASDLDGDGLVDLVARDQGEFNSKGDTLFILKHYPQESWSTRKIMIPDGEGLKVADLNADKKPDIIVNGLWLENTGVITNWGKHIFTRSWTWSNTYIDAGDINGDGKKDIILSPSEPAGMNYHISWFEQGHDPYNSWKEHIIVDSIETVIHFIGLADFNLDGRTDVAYAEMKQGKYPHEVVILAQRKKGWSKNVISSGGSHSMRITDWDGDHDPDLYGANWQEDTVKVWVNHEIN